MFHCERLPTTQYWLLRSQPPARPNADAPPANKSGGTHGVVKTVGARVVHVRPVERRTQAWRPEVLVRCEHAPGRRQFVDARNCSGTSKPAVIDGVEGKRVALLDEECAGRVRSILRSALGVDDVALEVVPRSNHREVEPQTEGDRPAPLIARDGRSIQRGQCRQVRRRSTRSRCYAQRLRSEQHPRLDRREG